MIEPQRPKKCRHCGAGNPEGDLKCWLCSASLDAADKSADGSLGSTSIEMPLATAVGSTTPLGSGQMQLATIFLLMTLSAVIVALIGAAPGLGILMAIVATPPVIRTMLVVKRRAQSGQQVGAVQKVLLFLSSLGTIAVVTLLAVCSSIGTFCGICLSSGKDSTIPIAALVALITASITLFFCGKWIRSRWRRDTQVF